MVCVCVCVCVWLVMFCFIGFTKNVLVCVRFIFLGPDVSLKLTVASACDEGCRILAHFMLPVHTFVRVTDYTRTLTTTSSTVAGRTLSGPPRCDGER